MKHPAELRAESVRDMHAALRDALSEERWVTDDYAAALTNPDTTHEQINAARRLLEARRRCTDDARLKAQRAALNALEQAEPRVA